MNFSCQRLLTWRGALLALALVAAVGGLARLGVWQLHRGHQKQVLIDGYQLALRSSPLPLTRELGTRSPDHWMPVKVHGRYLGDRQLLLDNQSQGENVGFDVWTPLRSDDGALVLVDRGWIPHAQHNSVPPPAATVIEVQGLWRALPAPGLRLQADNCSAQGWPRVVEYPTLDDLHCLLVETPLAGVLLLSADAADGFVRDWHPAPGFPPERHYAYAMQWFALAATLLVLSLRILLKATP